MPANHISTQFTPKSPSQIPVITPKPAQSTLPSSLSLPQLSLVTPTRRASASDGHRPGAPTSLPPSSKGGNSHPSGTGIPAFRSIRSFLAFGSSTSKSQSPSVGGTSNVSKGAFPTLASVRRSMTADRKVSSSHNRAEDKTPIISIEAPPRLRELDLHDGVSVSFSHNAMQDKQTSLLHTGNTTDLSSPGQTPGADLSTIIEGESSSISKYIPRLHESDRTVEGSSRETTPESEEKSQLYLSTSEIQAEVLDAIKRNSNGHAKAWLEKPDGLVIVAEASDEAPPRLQVNIGTFDASGDAEHHSLSFNIGALDPDLAALLSPNRLPNLQEPAAVTADPVTTPTLTSDASSPGSPSSPYTENLTPPFVPSESSPLRTRSSSLTRAPAGPSRSPSLSNYIDITSTRLGSLGTKGSGKSSFQISPKNPSFDDGGRRASSDSLPRRRVQPQSPFSASEQSLPRLQPGHDVSVRKQTRLFTPSRFLQSSKSPPVSYSQLHKKPTSPTPLSGDANSTSPPSRAPSSLSMTTALRSSERPSMEAERRSRLADPDRTFLARNRKRSMSVEEGSPVYSTPHRPSPTPVRPSSSNSAARPTMEWLGPRTAKAFAAAGLLDFDTDDPNGQIRNTMYRATSERYTPSRLTVSESSGPNVSWGRSRSASRTMTPTEAGRMPVESPLFSTPRTAVSASSTAPTTVSTSSSIQNLQSNIQVMKEKHDVETEALLSALSDSQRVTKVLREENSELRDHVQDLERQLSEANSYIRHLETPAAQPTIHTLPRRNVDRPRRTGSVDGQRKHSQLSKEFFFPLEDLNHAPPLNADIGDRLSPAVCKSSGSPAESFKRLSTTSSVFPVLPSNMSLLLQEDGNMTDRSGGFSTGSFSHSPPSPSVPIPKGRNFVKHGHTRSISSGNISPTTAGFSMTEMTSSPGSLNLRPEHELHLDDMPSLDLRSEQNDL